MGGPSKDEGGRRHQEGGLSGRDQVPTESTPLPCTDKEDEEDGGGHLQSKAVVRRTQHNSLQWL